MSEPTNDTQAQTTTDVQEYADLSQVIVTRGSKNVAKGTAGKVLGYDKVNKTYAVITEAGPILTLKPSMLGRPPVQTIELPHLAALVKGNMNAENGELYLADFVRSMDNNFPGFSEILAKA